MPFEIFFLTMVLIVTMVIVVDEAIGCRCFLLSYSIVIGALPIITTTVVIKERCEQHIAVGCGDDDGVIDTQTIMRWQLTVSVRCSEDDDRCRLNMITYVFALAIIYHRSLIIIRINNQRQYSVIFFLD
jgi:hypothetical protein